MRFCALFAFAAGVAASMAGKEMMTNGVSQLCENMGFVRHSEGRKLLAERGQVRFRNGQDPEAAADPAELAGKSLSGDHFTVGVCPYPPYAYQKGADDIPDPTAPEGSTWTGFAVETFELVAKENKIAIKYVNGTYDELVKKLDKGEIDTLAPGMFLTKRVRTLYKDWGFSHAFWQAGISILIKTSTGGNTFIAMMSNVEMWQMVFVLIATLIASGHVYWLIERRTDKEDKDFYDEDGNLEPGFVPKGYLTGVTQGTWWAAATITTAGYGDSYPKTWGGRCFAVNIMILSLFLVGLFTGAVTSAMTMAAIAKTDNGVQNLDDLTGKNVAVLAGSFPAHFMEARGKSKLTTVERMRDATALLEDGKVDAIVGIADVLRYQAVQHPGETKMVGFPFHQHALVWPFPSHSASVKKFGGTKVVAGLFSQSLLALEDTPDGDQVIQKYFADK